MENKIFLDLGDKSYDIIVGSSALKNISDFVVKKNYSKIFIITDQKVAKLHLAKLQAALSSLRITVEVVITKGGEKTKSFKYLEKICEEILQKGVDRKSLIIAFGGGVIGDISGFIASILVRGIDFVQIPTTLLAAVDSSVGGKTAINSKFGKNLIGTFYQPKLVICDLDFLKTLDARQMKAGYGEVIKYGLIYDRDFFEFLEKNFQKIFEFDGEILARAILKSCEIKAKIVSIDEKEQGLRAILNFGHTFGHVFETELNYSDRLLHGEAVAMGMFMALKMSLNFKMISAQDLERVKKHFEAVGLNLDPKKIKKNWSKKNLVNHLFKDKKHENKNLTFILLDAIGSAAIKKSVELKEFEEVLGNFIS